MNINNVSKSYDNNQVLSDIKLDFQQCGMIFIHGQSGSGKSTLLNILGMIDEQYQGEIYLADRVVGKTEKEMYRHRASVFAFVFQEFNLIHSLSVKQNIQISLRLSGTKFDQAKYTSVMSQFGIIELENRRVETLSGGEKQRAAIVRAILRNSMIILADEPTGNLDEENADILMRALKELSKTRMVIVVTHNMEYARQYADRTIYLKKGRVIDDTDNGYKENNPHVINDKLEYTDSKLDFDWCLRLNLSSFRHRKRRIFPVMILMTTVLLCIALMLGFYSGFSNLMNDMNQSVLESDLVKIGDYKSNALPYVFPEKTIAVLNDLVQTTKVMPYYELHMKILSGEQPVNANYTAIDYSDFYRQRMGKITGRFIEKYDEIIVSSGLAQKLAPQGNCIDQILTVQTINSAPTDLKIAGVCELSGPDGDRIYITSEMNSILAKKVISLDNLMGFIDNDLAKSVFCPIKKYTSEQKILTGLPMSEQNGLFINPAGFNKLLTLIRPDIAPFSLDEIAAGLVPDDLVRSVLTVQLTLQASDFIPFSEVKIQGICLDPVSTQQMILYAPQNLIDQYDQPFINRINLYLRDYSQEGRLEAKNKIESLGLRCELPSENAGAMIMTRLSVIVIVLLLITFVLTLLTCLMINFSIKMSIMDRTYEIGVLKSLGAPNASIFKLFFLDCASQGLAVSILASMIIVFANLSGAVRSLMISGAAVYRCEAWHILVVIFIGCAIAILAGLKETFRVSRMTIIKAIRQTNQ